MYDVRFLSCSAMSPHVKPQIRVVRPKFSEKMPFSERQMFFDSLHSTIPPEHRAVVTSIHQHELVPLMTGVHSNK